MIARLVRTFATVLIGLVASLCLLGTAAAQDKVVYHIDDAAEQATKALRNMRNQLDVAPNTTILVVAHANGIDFLMEGAKDKKNPDIDYSALVSALKARGVRFSLDDFGTGYSSLAYLKRFPIDDLKIDRAFVRGVPHDAEDVAIARAILALARSLDLTPVAEGVETVEQRDWLIAHHCTTMQGFLVAPGLPVARASTFPTRLDWSSGRPDEPPHSS